MNTADYNGIQNSADVEKINRAYRLLFNWSDCVAETEKEYLSRARKIRLISVMKKVIENELDETQRKILSLRHFENRSYDSIAGELYMSPSAVLRGSRKAEKIISSYMKYVIEFSNSGLKYSDKPLDVKMAVADLMLEKAGSDKMSARLRKARSDKFISLEKAALCTGIPKSRIEKIEENDVISIDEMKRLISFYGVSADYIFYGAK